MPLTPELSAPPLDPHRAGFLMDDMAKASNAAWLVGPGALQATESTRVQDDVPRRSEAIHRPVGLGLKGKQK